MNLARAIIDRASYDRLTVLNLQNLQNAMRLYRSSDVFIWVIEARLHLWRLIHPYLLIVHLGSLSPNTVELSVNLDINQLKY